MEPVQVSLLVCDNELMEIEDADDENVKLKDTSGASGA